mmetsp:Transcript_23095/g.80131  ORF Transcript_23095/g.80131 Transcript_23095/m.80131 type:complete len:159 (+) Transcript_23095:120-596(+)
MRPGSGFQAFVRKQHRFPHRQVHPNQLEAEALVMSCLKHDRFQEKKKCTCGKSRQYSQRGAAEATHALDNDKAGASTGGTAQDLATAAGAAGQSVIYCRDDGFMDFKRKAPAPPDAAASPRSSPATRSCRTARSRTTAPRATRTASRAVQPRTARSRS